MSVWSGYVKNLRKMRRYLLRQRKLEEDLPTLLEAPETRRAGSDNPPASTSHGLYARELASERRPKALLLTTCLINMPSPKADPESISRDASWLT